MTFFEKIKKYPLRYFIKFCIYITIIIIIYYIEKLLFNIINLFFYFCIISILIQIILHLCLLRYLVLKVEFPGLSYGYSRIHQIAMGKKQAIFLLNQLESIKTSIDLVFSKEKPLEELKHLSVIIKNVKYANEIIKNFKTIFTQMKTKFNKLTIDQNIFHKNITNLYNLLEESEYIKVLSNVIKQLRLEKVFFIKDLSLNAKEKFYNEKKEIEKYIENIRTTLNLLIDQITDFIGENYYFFSPRYIRNIFKNYLFASIYQFHVELDFYFEYEDKKLKVKDGNIIDYIIIKGKNWNNNDDKKLMIICGPNGEPYQIFSRNLFTKYLSKGIDVLCWNYRGYGFSTGVATFDNMKSDVIEIYEEIEKLKIYNKFGVHGISIGGVSCCYLANQKKDICLLVSDRNFGQIEYIARSYNFGKYLVLLYNFLFIPSSRNVEDYIETNAYKIILNDPKDFIVTETGSLKTLISEEFCNRYLEINKNALSNSIDNSMNTNDNTIELETLDESNISIISNKDIKIKYSNDNLLNDIIISSENNNNNQKVQKKSILDIILSNNKKIFLDCLINISEALNDEKLNINKNKNKNNLCNKILKIFNVTKKLDEYSYIKEEELENLIGLIDFIRNKISICLKEFRSAGDTLYSLTQKKGKYLNNLFIENFFNNLFIWGAYDKRDNYGSAYHSTENIDIILSKVISMLNLFLSSPEIKFYKNIDIINDIETFYNYLITIKTNIRYLGIKNKKGFVFLSDGSNYEKELIKLGRGNFVWLNCGHNGLPSSEEKFALKHYLKETDFFKKVKNDKINVNEEDKNFGDKKIFYDDIFDE